MLKLISTIIHGFLGGLFARMDGGGKPTTPEILERILCMSYFVIACIPFAGAYALLAFLGAVGIATGHGQYFLARMLKAIKPEKVDFIVRCIFGPDWRTQFPKGYEFDNAETVFYNVVIYPKLYKRNVFGMFVTGTLVGLPAALLAIYFGAAGGLLFLLTGVVKAVSYIIGYELYKSTEVAEWLNGAGRTVLCIIVLYITSL